ncbi:MAG: trigger factor [Candidatus Pacebacteria bacterium]|nr:trigger factor [Candidatus Paceibacterota bacterium]
MKYEIKEISTTRKKVEVELNAEEFSTYYMSALKNFVKDVELHGFRKGKAPDDMVESKVSPADLLSEASEYAIRDTWIKILKESKIEAVSQPNVQITKAAKDNPFIFTIEIDVLPDIKLPDLKTIGKDFKKEEIKVDESEIEDAIRWLRQSRAKFTVKETEAEKDDMVEISFVTDIKDDKEKQDRFVLGKEHYIKGMDEALMGAKKGEEKEFETINPQDKKEKIKIKVKVIEVKKVELPEFTDEWVKTLGKFDSIEALKTDIKKGITEEKEMAQKQKKREDVIKKLLEKTSFEVPESMAKREADHMISSLKQRITQELGISFEQYLEQIKKKEDEIIKDFEGIAKERVRGYLVLRQIEKDEKIEIQDKEINEKIEEIINQYPDKEQARKQIDMEQAKMYVEDELKREKIFNILGC